MITPGLKKLNRIYMSCSYLEIQTPVDVWESILKLHPVDPHEIFFEPFAGENSLYDQVECLEKHWTEITRGKCVFQFDKELTNRITCIYTNPPYMCPLKDKKGNIKVRNAVYYFLEYFMTHFVSLERIGFIMNMACFSSLTPKRLEKLKQLGFTISNIVTFNCNYWYGLQLFVLFDKKGSKCFQHIEKTFLRT